VPDHKTFVVVGRLIPDGALAGAWPEAELHDVGKRPGRPVVAQEQINRLLVGLASGGKSVVRLKGGDPFVFGRGGEEAQALTAAGIPFEVVPRTDRQARPRRTFSGGAVSADSLGLAPIQNVSTGSSSSRPLRSWNTPARFRDEFALR
jgi:hypothetical protein